MPSKIIKKRGSLREIELTWTWNIVINNQLHGGSPLLMNELKNFLTACVRRGGKKGILGDRIPSMNPPKRGIFKESIEWG